jgi:kynurenine formamidase
MSTAPRTQATWELAVGWPSAGPSRVYDLAQPLATGIPHHPNHPPFSFALTKRHGDVMYPEGVSASAEMITLGGHVGTHIDGFAHVSKDGRIHGGVEIGDAQSFSDGMGVGAVHELAPVLAPGHLVDVPRLVGRDLTPDDEVGPDLLAEWFSEHPGPEPGDVVLVRTGWDRHWHDPRTYLGADTGNPGVSLAGARWLSERRVVATGADTIAYEKMPNPTLDVHVHLLVESGIPIMEALDLRRLAADQVWDFFFLAVPLHLKGGTGSPIRPLAFAGQEAA